MALEKTIHRLEDAFETCWAGVSDIDVDIVVDLDNRITLGELVRKMRPLPLASWR
jgi:hypothetical protein